MKKTKKLIYLLVLTICCLSSTLNAKESSKNDIIIDPNFVIQSDFYGGAVQWEPNDVDAMNEAQWERLLKRVEFMKLGYIRCVIRPYAYCYGFENGKPQYIWDKKHKVASGDASQPRGRSLGLPQSRILSDAEWHSIGSRQWEDLLKILKFCQEQNIDVMLGEWGFPDDKNMYFLQPDDPKYAEIIAECVKYLVDKKGFTCVKQYNMGNEVNINPLSYSWENWSQGIRNLYAAFEKRNLAEKVVFVGPDGGYWKNLWFNNTLNQLSKEVKVLDYHWYIDRNWLNTNRVEDEMRIMRFFTSLTRPEMPIVFGEVGVREGHNEKTDQHNGIRTFDYGVGMADIMIQSMRAGWSAVTAWDMDDAMHYHSTGDVKIWGFWNSMGASQGRPEDEEIRPWFYVWSLLSRHFPKGSDILYSNSFRRNGLNCVAVKSPDGNVSFAIVNNSDFQQSVNLKIRALTNSVSLNKYTYFDNDRPVDADGFPVVKEVIKEANLSGTGVQIDFDGEGMVLLSTMGIKNNIPKFTTVVKELYDPLDGLQRLHSHSKNLGMNGFAEHYDECDGPTGPLFFFPNFLNDPTTIHPSTDNEEAYISYAFNNLTNFEIGVSGISSIKNRFKVYGSTDGASWNEITIEYPEPVLTIRDWYHTTLKPASKSDKYNYIKIAMNPNGRFDSSRIREVKLFK